MLERSREQVLLDRCLGGDFDAYGELVESCERAIYNCAYRMLSNSEDAADVAQTTFLKAFERLDTFDSSRTFFSWIYRIAVNESIDQQRRRKLEPLPDTDYGTEDEDVVAQRELEAQVQNGLMLLSTDLRAVVVLRHFGDKSYDEIGEILELAPKTVKSRLYTARQQLKSSLEGMRAEVHI